MDKQSLSSSALTHDCPACVIISVRYDQFACRRCWYRLPKIICDAIWAGFRSGDRNAHAHARREAYEWYAANPTNPMP